LLIQAPEHKFDWRKIAALPILNKRTPKGCMSKYFKISNNKNSISTEPHLSSTNTKKRKEIDTTQPPTEKLFTKETVSHKLSFKQQIDSIKDFICMQNLDSLYKINLITNLIKSNSLCGSHVQKHYINTSKPYNGEVTDIEGAKYKVKFEDGMEETLSEAEVLDIVIKECIIKKN
jgi:hypothetical protein